MTFTQILKHPRIPKLRRTRCLDFEGSPHKKAICVRLEIHKPKKPNSARRKVARVTLSSNGKQIFCYIPGIGHNLQKFGRVLARGGRRRDIPGSKYSAIRGKFDLGIIFGRKNARSKYGMKKVN